MAPALTKWDVLGRGKQQGIQVGGQLYDDLSKCMILIVVNDEEVDSTLEVIRAAAFTYQLSQELKPIFCKLSVDR